MTRAITDQEVLTALDATATFPQHIPWVRILRAYWLSARKIKMLRQKIRELNAVISSLKIAIETVQASEQKVLTEISIERQMQRQHAKVRSIHTRNGKVFVEFVDGSIQEVAE